MLGVTLKGFFSNGDSAQLHEDRCVIDRVTKFKDDLWKFEARIPYNKQDMNREKAVGRIWKSYLQHLASVAYNVLVTCWVTRIAGGISWGKPGTARMIPAKDAGNM